MYWNYKSGRLKNSQITFRIRYQEIESHDNNHAGASGLFLQTKAASWNPAWKTRRKYTKTQAQQQVLCPFSYFHPLPTAPILPRAGEGDKSTYSFTSARPGGREGREENIMKSSISVKVQYSGGKPFVITNGARTFLQDDLSGLPTAFTVNGEWYLKLDAIKFK